MKKFWFVLFSLFIFFLWISTSFAQNLTVNNLNIVSPSTISGITGNFSSLSVGSGSQNAISLNPGATSSAAATLAVSGTGGITLGTFTTTTTGLLSASGGPEGTPGTYAYNRILNTTDQADISSGAVSSLLIRDNYGGGSSDGGRNTLLVTSQLVGTIGTDNPYYVSAQFFNWDGGNVSGATTGNPLGDFYGIGLNQQISAGSYAYGETGEEFDYDEASGAVVKYMEFVKLVDNSPAGVTATANSAYLRFESSSQTMDMGLTFGDPQASGGGFPVNSTGTLIYSYGGTAGVGIDMSLDTFGTDFIKGPGGFAVDNNNGVHTNMIWAENGASVDIMAPNGSPYFQAEGPTSPTAYISAQAVASGAPTLYAAGNASMGIKTGGTAGTFSFLDINNYPAMEVNEAASPANYLSISGVGAGTPVLVSAQGTDTNIGINLVPKGTGTIEANGTAGVTCSGSPTSSFAATDGIVTHC